MSTQKVSLLTLTVTAAASITAYHFMGFDGNLAAAAANALGVATTDANAGDTLGVDVLGTTVVEASAAIASGAAIEVAAGGKAVTLAAGKQVARALEAASAAGDLIEVLLIAN